eukprot:m.169669 g.169669  ORF g.169669 m.169669 type:complete len:326 (+) comp17810_c7_seq2:2101-3078(+)
MGDAHKDQKHTGLLGALGHAAHAVKKSPQIVRKKIGHGMSAAKKAIGGSKEYSSLSDCQENGWLHPDEKIAVGVSYKIKYIGSIEIQFIPNNPTQNNVWAIEAMRTLQTSLHSKGTAHKLNISAGRVTLSSLDDKQTIMRHSTSRIAYSTVDSDQPKLFCYVALPKTQATPLCHVFYTKSPRQSYELTFTCAQAFDMNYKQWKKNKTAASIKATASEAGDVEPATAHRSPKPIRKVQQPKKASPLASSETKDQAQEEAGPSALETSGIGNVIPTDMLEVDDDEDDGYMDVMWESMSEARTVPSMLEIGVEPEEYNAAEDHEGDED